MSIPSHVLDQLSSRADLVGIIGKHTTLKKAGREFKGCCPFHGEKTPSFYVNPQKNMYNCFGCGVGGNAITFLKDYENLTFMEAVNELSRQTGVEVPKDDQRNLTYQKQMAPSQRPPSKSKLSAPTKPQSTPQVAAQTHPASSALSEQSAQDAWYLDAMSFTDAQEGDPSVYQDPSSIHPAAAPTANGQDSTQDTTQNEGNLYDLLAAVAHFYQQNLQQYPNALAYFKKRGLSDATIDTFALGYAPKGWQHLAAAFGSDIEGLKVLGLIRTSDSGRDYDLLRDRVIFPIKDNQGRIIGFAGRALGDDVKPKYINSSDSPVFHKQHVLYGYFEARQHRANDWLIVEGYMDVIALYQAGIYGAVASMGTALAESQISRLLQLNPVLTLCFDGDGAGQKAAWRALETALPVLSDDKELRFLTLARGHDPDTFVKSHGADAMRQQIGHAVPLSHYVFAYLSEQQNIDTPEGKAKVMAQLRQLTNQLPKGSSYRYLLNNDIYARLGGKPSAGLPDHKPTLDYTGWLTTLRQLELCLLYHPYVLANDPLQHLYHTAQLDMNTDASTLPSLPSWHDLADDSLRQVIDAIHASLFMLLDTNDPATIHTQAHFIIAGLPTTIQRTLSLHWQTFWADLQQHDRSKVEALITDLLVRLVLEAIKQQIIDAKGSGIRIISQLNKRQQRLSNWHKQWHASLDS